MTGEQQTLGRGDEALLQQAQAGSTKLRKEIGKVIVGQDEAVRPLLAWPRPCSSAPSPARWAGTSAASSSRPT